MGLRRLFDNNARFDYNKVCHKIIKTMKEELIEEFRDYPGSHIEVSNFGYIRNKVTGRINYGSKHGYKGKYRAVSVKINGKYKTKTIHRLVAELFMPESEMNVSHIDGNSQNNRLDNLHYTCHSGGKMVRHLTDEQVTEVFKLVRYHGQSNKAVADRFGVSPSLVGNIKHGRSYKSITQKLLQDFKRNLANSLLTSSNISINIK